MLKRTIKYTDFDDVEQTEVCHFNLTKAELIEMELAGQGGSLAGELQASAKSEDKRLIVSLVKRIVLMSYGVREGSKFLKSQELRDAFEASAAYDSLFIEFVSQPNSFTEFIMGVIPKDLIDSAQNGTPAIETVNLPEKPKDPKDMTREELLAAFKAKNQADQ